MENTQYFFALSRDMNGKNPDELFRYENRERFDEYLSRSPSIFGRIKQEITGQKAAALLKNSTRKAEWQFGSDGIAVHIL